MHTKPQLCPQMGHDGLAQLSPSRQTRPPARSPGARCRLGAPLRLATPNQQLVGLDLDGDVLCHTDDLLDQRAVRAQHLVFDGEIVGFVGTDEAEAGEAVLRLLGQNPGWPSLGRIGHRAGFFPVEKGAAPL